MSTARTLAIAQPAAAPLSPAQKKFNSLVKRIAEQSDLLAQWELAVPLVRERRAREFAPLLDDYRVASAQMVRVLHAAAGRKGLSRTEREMVSALIVDLAGSLADSAPDEALRAEMKQRYNDHADSDFDDDDAASDAMAREMARDLFGMDIPDDVDPNSPEELMRHIEQQMRADAQRADAQAQAQSEADRPRRSARKPGKREQQAAEQAQQASQSLREVYRKLASALHPDREPDPAERARKTALMQRVNQAYANNRLLDLLQLQLEAEQIDPAHLAGLSAERLKHYNHVLAEQLRELQHEVAAAEGAIVMEFNLHPLQRLKPAVLMDTLRHQIAQLTMDTHELRQQLPLLDDMPTFKRWLKMQRDMLRAQQREDDLMSLFGR